jgi:hypothetical protein
LAELERCRNESADVFCLILMGSKIGPISAPARISKSELEGLLKLMTQDDVALVLSRYELDDNRVDSTGKPTPEYILKESASMENEDELFSFALMREQDREQELIEKRLVSSAQQSLECTLSVPELVIQGQCAGKLEQALQFAALKHWPDLRGFTLDNPRRYSFERKFLLSALASEAKQIV